MEKRLDKTDKERCRKEQEGREKEREEEGEGEEEEKAGGEESTCPRLSGRDVLLKVCTYSVHVCYVYAPLVSLETTFSTLIPLMYHTFISVRAQTLKLNPSALWT